MDLVATNVLEFAENLLPMQCCVKIRTAKWQESLIQVR
jgi:hypothetical protein